MDISKVIKELSNIENANADVFRISVIIKLCNVGMQYLSDHDKKRLPFTTDCIGDAFDVLGDTLERLHEAIDEARQEIEDMAKAERNKNRS